MLSVGSNLVDGISVEVIRKRVRRISIRVCQDGTVRLTVPKWWVTLREAETFLLAKIAWVRKTREVALSRPVIANQPLTEGELLDLRATLGHLQSYWATRLHEDNVTWKLRNMKTQWGSCHFRKRLITYNTELARVPRELIEYVVVHELTHLVAHDHGPNFYSHMDERLPDWKTRRTRLNNRDYGAKSVKEQEPTHEPSNPSTPTLVQAEFEF